MMSNYKYTLASDLERDGMWLELEDTSTEDYEIVLAAFKSDADDKFTFHAFRNELSFAVVEDFVAQARQRLA